MNAKFVTVRLVSPNTEDMDLETALNAKISSISEGTECTSVSLVSDTTTEDEYAPREKRPAFRRSVKFIAYFK